MPGLAIICYLMSPMFRYLDESFTIAIFMEGWAGYRILGIWYLVIDKSDRSNFLGYRMAGPGRIGSGADSS
ncbi:hypothetical protein K458DRAFT_99683 [Lentithecium fluviatile CBS 122367]|uniref:Uncharacterized protein n=1 Tax=Lentithecium fluviatile CBS 122367 TaxID=1168545 RepID=A0A6G1JI01_9PLEO|nr:hypothetical protein K458DRAFT_99683 [Lentithecium fluviatile CBS 122367]